jgi:VanZ family protein
MTHQHGFNERPNEIRKSVRALLAFSGIFCVLLDIYASIVPLEFSPLPWAESMDRWRSIPWLELSVWERADWIANTLIFIPPTFLICGYICSSRNIGRGVLFFRLTIWFVFMALLVVGIELIQIWFPPRTVSWNDIVAGVVGVLLGVLGWLVLGPFIVNWFSSLLQKPSVSSKVASVVIAGMLVCVLYSLYPFDVVFSLAEMEEKRIQGRLRWWTDTESLGLLSILQSWTLAALRMVPFGLGLGWRTRPWFALPIIGVLSILFEVIQIPIFSKHAAGDEVLAGICGGVAGWWIARNAKKIVRVFEHPGTWLLCIATCITLVPIAFVARYQMVITDPEVIVERWWGVLTPPLSRYYYTSEYSALTNLAGKMAMFGVLGMCIAGYSRSRQPYPYWRYFIVGLLMAAFMGCMIEVLQVYLAPFIADLSDVIIYLVGYGLGFVLGFWFFWDSRGHQEE